MNPHDLKPYKKNARKHAVRDIEAIKASIQQFGFNDPIGVWKDTIVEGHGRQIAAIQLGMDKVPIMRLDHMTDEERRAYTLAHNGTAELSEWDFDIRDAEILDIQDIDMTAFGFEIPDFGNGGVEGTDDGAGYYGDERERTFDKYNLESYDPNRVAGKYELPTLKRCDFVPDRLIGFNYVLNTAERDAGVHYFIDDYQFERVWTEPQFYLEKVSEFQCMCTPDFSLYTDMPMAMKIWNVYRSRLIGQIASDMGIKVVPTIQFAGEDTHDWAFEGIEGGGTVATSTVGVMRDRTALKLWQKGMERAIEAIKPKTIVLYGTDVDFDFSGIDIVKIRSRQFSRGEE